MSYTPKPGDTVYSADGSMALYVSTAKGGGYIVQPLLEDGDGVTEPEGHYADGVDIWPRVYREPPQPMLAAEIAAQQETLAALRREIAEAERLKREADSSMGAVKERLQMHQALAALDDLLSGRITHYAIDNSDGNNGRWEVVSAAEFKKLRAHYSVVGLRLYVNLNWTGPAGVQWKFTPNHEGSDKERDAYAFTSEEAARAKVVKLVTKQVMETAAHASNAYWLRQRIDWCKKQGVPVPEAAAEKLAQLERQDAEAAAKKAREDLQRAQAALDALQQAA